MLKLETSRNHIVLPENVSSSPPPEPTNFETSSRDTYRRSSIPIVNIVSDFVPRADQVMTHPLAL